MQQSSTVLTKGTRPEGLRVRREAKDSVREIIAVKRRRRRLRVAGFRLAQW